MSYLDVIDYVKERLIEDLNYIEPEIRLSDRNIIINNNTRLTVSMAFYVRELNNINEEETEIIPELGGHLIVRQSHSWSEETIPPQQRPEETIPPQQRPEETISPQQRPEETIPQQTPPLCCVCMTRSVRIVFQPCFHVNTCDVCGINPLINSCPICRRRIENRNTLFF
jgi:hypothetical protein